MAFMSLEIFFFDKKLVLLCILFSIFVYLLPSLINERSNNTLLAVAESAIEHFLMVRVWLYGFESVFRQVLFNYFVCSCLYVLFVTA